MELPKSLYLSLDQLSLDQFVSTTQLNSYPLDNPKLPNGEETETRDWASLPGELLISVASRLTSLADFFAFRRVCTSWRSNVIPSAHTLSSQSPLIMFHLKNRMLYNHVDEVTDGMSEDDVEFLDRPSLDVVFLDVMHQRFYKSESRSSWWSFNLLNFSHGYLAVARGDGRIQLRHFFTNDMIWLPKTRKPFSDNKNIIFSENPSSPQCMFGLYCHHDDTMEFCQQGESTWKVFTLPNSILVMDMVFFQRKTYALLSIRFCFDDYQLAVFEFTPSFKVKLLGFPTKFHQRPFLFSSGDELLLRCPQTIFTWDFRGIRWIPKSSLDGKAIFLSSNQLTACIIPNPGSWVKPNYKYYYDINSYSLMELLAIDDGSVEYVEYYTPLTDKGMDCKSWCMGRPLWIFPSLCFSN